MRQTIMLMAACAALLAGCTNEVGEGLGIDTPIQVTASVEGIMTTRAENTKDNLDNFGLSIKDGQSYTGNYAGENILAEKDNGTWTLGTTVLYQGNGQSYYAYAPYKEGHTGESLTFTVDANQATNGLQGSDLLHAAGTVESAKLDITLAHKLSKLTVTLTPEGFGTDEVSFPGVTLRGTLPITTLNLTDGAVNTATGTATDITMCPTGTTGTYECILVPQEATYSVLINATVGNEAKTYVYTPSAAYTFESDRSYTLALKVKKADVSMGNIGVNDWDGDDIPLTAGEATEKNYTIEADGSYTVYTAKGLLAWMEAADGEETINCTLAANIDMTEQTLPKTDVLNLGTFDGMGHTITGLTDCLIYSNTGTIRNLTLIEPDISSSRASGTVAVYNEGTIENCHVVGGKVHGSEECGGIVGYNGTVGESAIIRACSSTSVSSTSGHVVGGIAGVNSGGTILASYATGSVTMLGDYDYIGAIVGYNLRTITACYWSGDAEKGVGVDLGTNNTTKVEGDVSWADAAEAMNEALKTDGSTYRWKVYEGDETGNRPLVIVTR